MLKSFDKYEVHIFDITSAMNQLKEEKVVIYKLEKIDAFTYTFLASPYCRNRIKKVFVQPKLIKKVGLFHIVENFFTFKTTALALIFSIVLFFLFCNRIWKINISGDNKQLYPKIQETLEKNKIKVGMGKINSESLLLVEEKILYDLKDQIEWLEKRVNGSTLTIKFLKKRVSNPPILLNQSLYATKDGVIHSFDIKNGEKMVKVNDYVKKGDLLVKDVVTTDQNEDVYVGTYCSVYAYTWYTEDATYTLKDNEAYDEVDVFSTLLIESRAEVGKEITENESIEKENVIQFKKEGKIITMKVHFTCIEDITKE